MTEIILPFVLTYLGGDADRHEIKAQSLGVSLSGAAKLYNAVAHYCAFGYIPRGNYKKAFQCYAKVPQDGSYEYVLVIAAIAQQQDLLGEISKEAMGYVFSRIIGALKGIWTKRGETGKVVEDLAKVLIEESKNRKDVENLLIRSITQSNDNMASVHGKLIETLPTLAGVLRNSARELVAPIGNTCKQIKQFSLTDFEVEITEPEAEVIRGESEMEVDDMQSFHCNRITEINVENGHCILDVEDYDHLITGKIDDPVLKTPHNVYTKALDNQTPVIITAKPVKKEGVIYRLYISDANEIG